MGFFSKFPYSNGYQLNLDWIIDKIKKFENDYDQLDPDSFLRKSGGDVNGALRFGDGGSIDMGGHDLTGLKDAVNSRDAVPLRQAQDTFVKKAGDSMTGSLNMGGNAVTNIPAPATDSDAANKKYVDDKIGTPEAPGAYLPLAGGMMSGNINMDGHAITGLPNAVNDTDALALAFAKTLFAPSGYGLGVYGMKISDCNDALKSGFYVPTGSTTANLPAPTFGYGRMAVFARDQNSCVQILVYANIIAIRNREDGVFDEWEYLNPPMAIGVEYRTTEQYNGHVVYTQLFFLGQLSGTANTAISVDLSEFGISAIVDWGGEIVDTVDDAIYAIPYKASSVEYITVVTAASLGVKCSVGTNKNKVYMWIKYCKG